MRDFSKVKRLVIKVGTNLLSDKSGINRARIFDIARQVSEIREKGIEVLLVSSGAIGLGAKKLEHEKAVSYITLRQAFAAIGQPLLMQAYEEAFSIYNLVTAQVLLTRSVMNNRTSYNNLRSSVSMLLKLGVIPVFNENDVISTSESGNNFGDNDRLSAYIASKIDADLLILLTDIDALYDSDPKKNKDARRLDTVNEITSEIFSYAKGKGSEFSTGGMKTKLLAAKIAQRGACATVIASGYEKDSLVRIMEGESIGTLILPKERISQKQRWIMNSMPKAKIIIDDGAKKALLENNSSLLFRGILEIKGTFEKGEVVYISDREGRNLFKAVPLLNSTSLRLVAGLARDESERILGTRRDIVFRPEDSMRTEYAEL